MKSIVRGAKALKDSNHCNRVIQLIKGNSYNTNWSMSAEHLTDEVIELNGGEYVITFTPSVGEDKNGEREVEIYHLLSVTDIEGNKIEVSAELETLIEKEL